MTYFLFFILTKSTYLYPTKIEINKRTHLLYFFLPKLNLERVQIILYYSSKSLYNNF